MNSESWDCEGWDCNPLAIVQVDYVDDELDLEEAESDWQVLALDRFADRMIRP